MNHTRLAAALVIVSSFIAAPAIAAPDTKAQEPGRVVNLPAEVKEPYIALSFGSMPFGSFTAANYVGTTKFSHKLPDELAQAATLQNLGDAGLLLAAGLVGGGLELAGVRGMGTVVGLGFVSLIPVIRNAAYAPYWGEQAVKFNVQQLERDGFKKMVQTERQ